MRQGKTVSVSTKVNKVGTEIERRLEDEGREWWVRVENGG